MSLFSCSPILLETGSPGRFPEPSRFPTVSPQRRACLRGATGRKPSGRRRTHRTRGAPGQLGHPGGRRASDPGLPRRGSVEFLGVCGFRCACAGAAWFLVTVEGVEAAHGSPGTQAHRGGRQDRARRPWRRPGRPAPAGGPGPRHRNGPDPAQGDGQVQRDPRPARAGRAPRPGRGRGPRRRHAHPSRHRGLDRFSRSRPGPPGQAHPHHHPAHQSRRDP